VSPVVDQVSAAGLAGMTPDQIAKAYRAGRLDALLGRTAAGPAAAGQVSEGDLPGMTPEQVAAAYAAGQLDALLGATRSVL
jgi:hypothetical protein